MTESEDHRNKKKLETDELKYLQKQSREFHPYAQPVGKIMINKQITKKLSPKKSIKTFLEKKTIRCKIIKNNVNEVKWTNLESTCNPTNTRLTNNYDAVYEISAFPKIVVRGSELSISKIVILLFNSNKNDDIPTVSTKKNLPKSNVSTTNRKLCNCTRSQCLKLYCDCFSYGEYCHPECTCSNCHNNKDYEVERNHCIHVCLSKNPNAFKSKYVRNVSIKKKCINYKRGCHCKKSGCLKNYCECYEANVMCSNLCKCQGCYNVALSKEILDSAVWNLARENKKIETTPTPFSLYRKSPNIPHVNPINKCELEMDYSLEVDNENDLNESGEKLDRLNLIKILELTLKNTKYSVDNLTNTDTVGLIGCEDPTNFLKKDNYNIYGGKTNDSKIINYKGDVKDDEKRFSPFDLINPRIIKGACSYLINISNQYQDKMKISTDQKPHINQDKNVECTVNSLVCLTDEKPNLNNDFNKSIDELFSKTETQKHENIYNDTDQNLLSSKEIDSINYRNVLTQSHKILDRILNYKNQN
ncbi:hypothetical protein A3Q56_01070 [Intoshia linei]|uniref:CRC domain-containing protein n=1 Tax=Intoshia linei TaxID=1819745 RepID=A0A177BC13_9BILA|nr:hypothetical protein A3Q56_01070 [Intoshia linei]